MDKFNYKHAFFKMSALLKNYAVQLNAMTIFYKYHFLRFLLRILNINFRHRKMVLLSFGTQ